MTEKKAPLAELTGGIVIATITIASIVVTNSEIIPAIGLITLAIITAARSYTRSKWR